MFFYHIINEEIEKKNNEESRIGPGLEIDEILTIQCRSVEEIRLKTLECYIISTRLGIRKLLGS